MKMPWSDLEGPAKVIAISVAAFFVAGGLCGVQWAVTMRVGGSADWLASLAIAMGVVEVLVMLLAVVGVVGGAVLLIAYRVRGDRTETVQTLFGSEERDEDRDE